MSVESSEYFFRMKNHLDFNLIVWGEAAMTHVWWTPFGSLFDLRKHNGEKVPEESLELIHKTNPSKTLVLKDCGGCCEFESDLNPLFIHTRPNIRAVGTKMHFQHYAFSTTIFQVRSWFRHNLCILFGLAISASMYWHRPLTIVIRSAWLDLS